jgi:hypothetical protein
MSLVLLVYLADIVRGLSFVFSLIGFPCLALGLIWIIGQMCVENIFKLKYLLLPLFGFLMLLLSVVTPRKEGIYLIAAAKGVETVAENPRIKEIAGNSLDLIESAVSKYTNELKKEKK